MPEHTTFDEAWADDEIFRQPLTELTDGADLDKPIALFCITLPEASRDKLEGGRQLYISYQTIVNRQGVTNGQAVTHQKYGCHPGAYRTRLTYIPPSTGS